VLPALPAGLALDPGTGVISGTPTTLTATAVYTITAATAAGNTTAGLTLTVVEAPPRTLTYTFMTSTYTTGNTIPANLPQSAGGPVLSYAVAPALPTGLGLNTGTGAIAFTISDVETAPQHLTLAANSSDTGLVKPTAIVFGGTGTNRTVTVTPESSRLGSAVITLTVNDGTRTATDAFTVTVTGTQQETWRFDRFGTTASAGMAASSANPDGDSWNNAQEYVLGTDPLSSNTGPQLGLGWLTNGRGIRFPTTQASGTLRSSS